MTAPPLPRRRFPRRLPAALALLGLLVAAPLSPALAQGPDEALPGAAETRQAGLCGGKDMSAELAADGRLAAIEAEAKAVPNGEGRLFRVERPGLAPSWLFGTMHLTDPRVLTLPHAADDAFAGARTLVIETLDVLDPTKSAAAMLARPDLTYLPQGQTLADILDEPDETAVRAALEAKGLSFASVERLQPWFVGTSLALPPCEASRIAAGAAVLDVALAARAKAEGKTVEGLESATEQIEALASLPVALQAESLVSTLALSDRLADIAETMVNLYLEGRIAEINPMLEKALPEGAGGDEKGSEAMAAFEERVVTARNRTMAERAEPILGRGGVFVAVGALHLPGEAGVVALLRDKGWSVTRAD